MYICANFRNPTENPNPTHMYKLHKFCTFCTYTKTCFFFTTIFLVVTKYITSFHRSSCSYRTIYSFHISLSAMIWLVKLECFKLCFPICLQSILFFEIDTFTPDTSTLSPFSIYFLLFIKQQNTMVEIRNIMCKNILEKFYPCYNS